MIVFRKSSTPDTAVCHCTLLVRLDRRGTWFDTFSVRPLTCSAQALSAAQLSTFGGVSKDERKTLATNGSDEEMPEGIGR